VSDQTEAESLDPEESASEAADGHQAASAEPKPLLTQAQLRTLRWVIPALWLLASIAVGQIAGVEPAFLVFASGVLVLVITLMWSSVQSLTGGSTLGFEEALGMGAPSKVEEEKRAVLRALKDLEYERGVGKISVEDYAELSAKYRAEAKRLIQSVDAALEPARREVEQALDVRLKLEGVALEAAAPASNEDKPSDSTETSDSASEGDEEPAKAAEENR
jgi:hypothetical protein